MLIPNKFSGYSEDGIRKYNIIGGLLKGLLGGGDPPPPPDYAAAARETAAGNKEAAQFAVNANRINQVTPYGSLTYSRAQPAFDQAGYDAAMAKFNTQPTTRTERVWDQSQGEGGDWGERTVSVAPGTGTAPRREDFMKDDGGGWTQTMNLTPQAQATLDKQMRLSDQYADTASKGFSNVQGLLENPNIDTSGMPQMRGIDMSQVSGVRGLNTEGLTEARRLDNSNLPGIRQLNTSNLNNIRDLDINGLQNVRQLGLDGLPQAPINAGQTAQDALFSRLNPTLSRDEEALRTRLANQGIALGSSAYNREMDLAGQRANDLRLQAAAQGISLDQAARNAAFGERKDLSAFDMGLNQQQFGQRQAMTAADLAKRNQMFGENQAMSNFDLAQRQQLFGENQAMTAADLANNNQLFGARQAMTNADLATANQQFGQLQNLAALSGNQRNQALQEAFAMQSRPLDLVSALRSGSQVQNPQFNSFAQQANVAGPDMLSATNMLYGQQMAGYNADQAAMGGLMSGLGGLALGGAKMGLFGAN